MISVTAFMLGFLTNQIRSDRIPLVADWAPEARLSAGLGESMVISLEEARALCSNKRAVFIDARPLALYDQGHIRCALNIPWQSFDEYIDRLPDRIQDDVWIVTYCDGEHCSLSEDLAKELIFMGYEKVMVLLNGWTRWVEAGLPVEKGHKEHLDGRKV